MLDPRFIMKGIEKPRQIEVIERKADFARVRIEPFERGYGTTIANVLRRVLLSSILGTAVTHAKIENVLHEFSTIPGVKDDVTDLILNLKSLKLKTEQEGPRILRLRKTGPAVVTAGDFETDDDIEILCPDQYIATINEAGMLVMEVTARIGRGYVSAEENEKEIQGDGVIALDSFFSPVERVSFKIENTRVGQRTDYERIILDVWHDGSIDIETAIGHAAKIIKDHMQIFINFEEPEEETPQEVDDEQEKLKRLVNRSIEEIELSVRSMNCLRFANIKTLGELAMKTEAELLKFRNFGKKSLNEIHEKLNEVGLHLGMKDIEHLLDSGREKIE